jgi:hypothetical protein
MRQIRLRYSKSPALVGTSAAVSDAEEMLGDDLGPGRNKTLR